MPEPSTRWHAHPPSARRPLSTSGGCKRRRPLSGCSPSLALLLRNLPGERSPRPRAPQTPPARESKWLSASPNLKLVRGPVPVRLAPWRLPSACWLRHHLGRRPATTGTVFSGSRPPRAAQPAAAVQLRAATPLPASPARRQSAPSNAAESPAPGVPAQLPSRILVLACALVKARLSEVG